MTQDWFPTPNNLTDAAHRFQHHTDQHGPYYLTIHPTQHGQALMAAAQAAHTSGLQLHIHHSDHQTPGHWHLSTEPLPGTRPAPSSDEEE